MNPLNSYIEHTNLKPTLIGKAVDRLVAEAIDYQFHGVCVPPFWVKRASREIGRNDTKLVTVIGFPLGYQMTETKLKEIQMAIVDGVDELDLVINISAFKDGMPWPKIEIAQCAKLCHSEEKVLKVIIETAYLTQNEIKSAALVAKDAGADFVKTSTGFASSGAQEKDIRLLRDILPDHVGIKASGGIKTRQHTMEMIAAGADRIGTSSGLEIIGAIA